MSEYVAEYLKCRDQKYVNKHKEFLEQNHLRRSSSRIVKSYDAIKLSTNVVWKKTLTNLWHSWNIERVNQPLLFYEHMGNTSELSSSINSRQLCFDDATSLLRKHMHFHFRASSNFLARTSRPIPLLLTTLHPNLFL